MLVAASALAIAGPVSLAAASPSLPARAHAEGVTAPQPLSSSEIAAFSEEPAETGPYAACPAAKKKEVTCLAAIVPTRGKRPVLGPKLEGSGEFGGLSPADVRSAYNLPATGGEGQKVAITIAFDDPTANADLKAYRQFYDLPECSEANGCFEKLNEKGEAGNYPAPDAGWAGETSLDLDMVSATCPKCHIMLIEAETNTTEKLLKAVEEAALKGATVISDSWGGPEFSEEASFDHYLHHSGIPVLFGSGDRGYVTTYPAVSPEVIAVGGTTLRKDQSARGWSESAWSEAGSGCSSLEGKPSWQKDSGCARRTSADVSAVADPATPVSVFDSYGSPSGQGWLLFGGTSVATPIMAGVEADSSSTFRSEGAQAFYGFGQQGQLLDVTEGKNWWNCSTYLCEAGAGFDGPTGLGTPTGPLFKSTAGTAAATVLSPTEAVLHGNVSPHTEYQFEFDTREYKPEEGSHGTSVPVPAAKSGSSETGSVPVSETVKGLAGHTTYHYRLVGIAINGARSNGADRVFGTTPPVATTESAGTVRGNDAVLHATVNPEGLDTHYRFEFGRTTAYGRSAPLPAGALGSGMGGMAVSQVVGPLADGQTYHFRIRATNPAGTVYGEDKTFTTPSSEWHSEALPGAGFENLARISCASASDCMAVGPKENVVSAWRLSGETWSQVALPNLETELGETVKSPLLAGISCASATSCTAAGRYTNGAGEARPLVEHWNGTKWSVEVGASRLGTGYSSLTGVSCPSASSCVAVGIKSSGGVAHVLAMSWSGSTWTLMEAPDSPAGDGEFQGISCTSTSLCMVVGDYFASGSYSGLSERWNGSAWTTFLEPAHAILVSVSCTGGEISSLRCMSTTTDASDVRWEGSGWTTIKGPPSPVGASSNSIRGLSCVSATECIAVGSAGAKLAVQVPMAATWNGNGWSLRSTHVDHEPGTGEVEALIGVSCPTSARCTAVGGAETSEGVLFPIAESAVRGPTAYTEPVSGLTRTAATLNGTVNPNGEATSYYFEYGKTLAYGTKTTEASAGSGTSNVKVNAALGGLSDGALYHYRVVAVSGKGTIYGEDRTFTPLEWSIQSPVNPSPLTEAKLKSVSCAAATMCMGVGRDYARGTSFMETWNGTAWKFSTESTSGEIKKVSCPTTTFCLAAGASSGGKLQSWRSAEISGSWMTVTDTPPTPSGGTSASLSGVSCSSESACTAVGSYKNSSNEWRSLVDRWNGSSWSTQTAPAPTEGTAETAMLAVSCSSSTSCTAVGKANSKPFAEHWNGTEWAIQSIPAPSGATSSGLASVSCQAAGPCMAIGSFTEGGVEKSLAERWNGSSWSITTTPNPSEATFGTVLTGVSCPSSTSCTAVGYYANKSLQLKSVAESWNGTAWELQTSPTPSGSTESPLTDVSCTAASACTAVGNAHPGPAGESAVGLAERWE